MSVRRPGTSRSARAAIVLLLGSLAGVILPLASASGAKPTPAPVVGIATSIRFDDVSTVGVTLPSGSPGTVGLWYAVSGEPLTTTLTFVDDLGDPAPLATNKSVTVSVSYGATVLGTKEVAANGSTAVVSLQPIADAVSNISLTASADTKPKPVRGTSRPFDVLIESLDVAGPLTSTGGGASSSPCSPAFTTVCADLIPPAGLEFGANGLLSRGVCVGTRCKDAYVQGLVTFAPSVTNPATLVMKCDKDLCGVGAIKNKTLDVTISPGSQVQGDPRAITYEAPACPDKGTVAYDSGADVSGTNLPFCVDYVQSTRDNAGDTILYLLFVEDLKVRFP